MTKLEEINLEKKKSMMAVRKLSHLNKIAKKTNIENDAKPISINYDKLANRMYILRNDGFVNYNNNLVLNNRNCYNGTSKIIESVVSSTLWAARTINMEQLKKMHNDKYSVCWIYRDEIYGSRVGGFDKIHNNSAISPVNIYDIKGFTPGYRKTLTAEFIGTQGYYSRYDDEIYKLRMKPTKFDRTISIDRDYTLGAFVAQKILCTSFILDNLKFGLALNKFYNRPTERFINNNWIDSATVMNCITYATSKCPLKIDFVLKDGVNNISLRNVDYMCKSRIDSVIYGRNNFGLTCMYLTTGYDGPTIRIYKNGDTSKHNEVTVTDGNSYIRHRSFWT